MKKIIIVIITLGLLSTNISGQVAIKKQSHNIQAGDEHHFFIAEKTDPGPSGQNLIWDFSYLTKKSELNALMYHSAGTEKSGSIPQADVVLEEFGTQFFFKRSGNRVELHGIVNKNGHLTTYDQPFVKMVFPLNFGDIHSGTFSGTQYSSNSSYDFSGHYHLEIDASGQLILPDNRIFNNVVRMKTIQQKQVNNSSSTVVSYKWYCKDLRYPLLTILATERDGVIKPYQTAYYSKTIRIENNDAEEGDNPVLDKNFLRVYPNPFSDKLTVNYSLMTESNVEITLFDNSGRTIKAISLHNQAAGAYNQDIHIDKNQTGSGVLYLRIKTGNETITQTVIRSE